MRHDDVHIDHLSVLVKTASAGFDALIASHREWWHEYYPQSFLTLAHPQLESFYWIQMYKIASATRADRPVYDLLGPWDVDTTRFICLPCCVFVLFWM